MSESRNRHAFSIRCLTYTAISAAMVFCTTFFIKIPVLSGYIHAGDGIVFLIAVWLPSPHAALAAAIGAGLADLIGGYPLWIPVTVVIRILSVCVFAVFSGRKKDRRFADAENCFALISAAVINVAGYFAFEAGFVYHSVMGALPGVPFNLIQSAVGAVIFLTIGKLADKGRIPLPQLRKKDAGHEKKGTTN